MGAVLSGSAEHEVKICPLYRVGTGGIAMCGNYFAFFFTAR